MLDDVEVGFRFHCDLIKSEEGTVHGERKRYVEGLASLETPDQEGETVVQKGINFNPFLQTGHLNWDHGPVRRGNPAYIIGEPTEAKIVRVPEQGCDAFFIKGYLYDDPELKPIADAAWKHLLTLQKSGSQRTMGFSVEGSSSLKVGKKIHKSTIYHVALTHAPVHDGTVARFAQVMKSLSFASRLDDEILAARDWDITSLMKAEGGLSVANLGTLQPLLKEDLPHGGKKKRRKGAKLDTAMGTIYGDKAVCKSDCYDDHGRFRQGAPGLLKHLVDCQGWELPEAEAFTTTIVGAW